MSAEERNGELSLAALEAWPRGELERAASDFGVGDAGSLTQFGVNLLQLAPGAWSSQRHWLSAEDEFVYVLAGEVVLISDGGEQILQAGMCAGYPAGKRDAHQFVNRSNAPAQYLEVGNRIEGDNAFYPDDDLMWIETESGMVAAHKDGARYER